MTIIIWAKISKIIIWAKIKILIIKFRFYEVIRYIYGLE
jgi:hypothetical protein